jgi:glycosyltransferase involved in cell wall biosynthesis
VGGKVSIIIALYNKAPYIRQCLDSVFAQTYKNFEVVVVDDGSTDDGYQEAYKWPVTLVRISNSGQSKARNSGAYVSTGDFLLPLDADDWIDPTYLEKTVPLCTENGVGIVSTDMVRFGLVNNVLPARPITIAEEKNYNEIPCCSLIRREAFLQPGGYNFRVDGYEDWNLWIDILKRGWKHAVVNEPLFHYRVLGNAANAVADAKRDELIKTIHDLHPEIYC